MSWMSRVRNVFRKDELDRELDEELRFHAEQRAADLGLSAEEALRRLGRVERIVEESRDAKLARWLESVLQDLRLAGRMWRKRPLLAVTAILTIALGAGMNVAVFRMIWNVLLKPLPYAHPESLVQIWMEDKDPRHPPRNAMIQRWRDGSAAFSGFATYRPWTVTVLSGGAPQSVFAGAVSHDFFETLGIPLLAGRAFRREETQEGGDQVALLRESYWRSRFGGRASVLDSEIIADGVPCRVVGIVPDSFAGAPLVQVARGGASMGSGARSEPDLFLPISRARVGGMRVPLMSNFVIGRLRPGVAEEQAEQELTRLAADKEHHRIWLSPLEREVGYKLRPALLALMAATACVLLIACANLANLMLAQVVMRRRELAVRAALGAGRGRVVRQLVTEALALSLAGGAVGLLVARSLYSGIVRLYPDTIPRAAGGAPDWIVYLFALGVTVSSGLLFGVLPAWRAAGEAGDEALRVGNAWMSRGSRRWSGAVVALQVSLTTVVLIAAGLLLRTFVSLRSVDIGMDREQVITASIDLPATRYKTRDDRARFGRAWVERLQSIPGVTAAGISNSMPLRYTMLLDLLIQVPGTPDEQMVGGRAVGGDYFRALGVRWASGGAFDENARDQCVVNEAFVRKFLHGQAAAGFQLPQGKRVTTITGVMRDVRQLGLREPAPAEMFVPFSSFPLNPVDTVVRTPLPVAGVVEAMRRELKGLDAALVLGRPMSMNEVVDGELARPRFQLLLLGLFAVVALVLAAAGTYGVIAYQVRSRVPEMGLRRALGAGTGDLLALVLRGGLGAPLAGVAVGLLFGGVVLGRLLESLLYGVTLHDPAVWAGAAGTLLLTSVAACLLPGRMAARVEPSVALRQE